MLGHSIESKRLQGYVHREQEVARSEHVFAEGGKSLVLETSTSEIRLHDSRWRELMWHGDGNGPRFYDRAMILCSFRTQERTSQIGKGQRVHMTFPMSDGV
jgi:hypothetical protein